MVRVSRVGVLLACDCTRNAMGYEEYLILAHNTTDSATKFMICGVVLLAIIIAIVIGRMFYRAHDVDNHRR